MAVLHNSLYRVKVIVSHYICVLALIAVPEISVMA